MIQDIYPHIYNNQYANKTIQDDDYVIMIRNREAIIRYEDEQICFPTFKEVKCEDYYYLFSIDNINYFTTLEEITPNGYTTVSVNDFRVLQPQHHAFAIIIALQLINWYRNTKYCPKCGKPFKHSLTERKLECECGYGLYPQICPAVIVGVINKDKILVTQYNNRNLYALIAGFNEIGESIEETVYREVMEEAGIKIKNLKYYKSQPWPYSGSLLFGFYCEVDGDDTITLDETELQLGKWMDRENIPEGYKQSLTSEMMLTFKEKGREVLK